MHEAGFLKMLRLLLQGSHLEILEPYRKVTATVQVLKEGRQDADQTFNPTFKAISEMTDLHRHVTPQIP